MDDECSDEFDGLRRVGFHDVGPGFHFVNCTESHYLRRKKCAVKVVEVTCAFNEL